MQADCSFRGSAAALSLARVAWALKLAPETMASLPVVSGAIGT